ncbi:hypothetical protein DL96DRAFT_1774469 [Flagelloscypha sp. PMI_526]|nr:hypothetical protein DL96DRAFT_1774469 [Flagelloscypha sp. PMI_526]
MSSSEHTQTGTFYSHLNQFKIRCPVENRVVSVAVKASQLTVFLQPRASLLIHYGIPKLLIKLTTMGTSEPLFPPEIERPIFHYCAHSDSAMISIFIRVSRRVKEWIEPLRFRCLHFKKRKASRLFRRLEVKTPDFLAQHVRHFVFGSSISVPEYHKIIEFLPLCPGIIDLAFFTGGNAKTFAQLHNYSQLQYLTLGYGGGTTLTQCLKDDPSAVLPITHLYAGWGLLLSLEMIIPSQLPNLSHITGEWPNESISAEYMVEEVDVVARMIEWDQIQFFVLCVDHGPSYSICKDGAQWIWYHPKVVQLESDWVVESLEEGWIGDVGTVNFWNAAKSIAAGRKV